MPLPASVRERIGPVAFFKTAVVVNRLPKTRSGKILRGTMQRIADSQAYSTPATIDDPAITLPSAQSTAVFRIVQEALTNVAKHARASRAEVALRRTGDSLEVTVRDDGVGFAVEEPRKPESFGLLGLRERISLLRGTASINSAPVSSATSRNSALVGRATNPLMAKLLEWTFRIASPGSRLAAR